MCTCMARRYQDRCTIQFHGAALLGSWDGRVPVGDGGEGELVLLWAADAGHKDHARLMLVVIRSVAGRRGT